MLLQQLNIGGRLVIPVGNERRQHLMFITRESEKSYKEQKLDPVSFVPMSHGVG